jgi:hypothetical protein
MDHVLYITLYPILVGVTVRAVRFEILIVTWFVGVGFVLASVLKVQAGMEGYMLIAMMVLSLTLVTENESFLRQSFLNLMHEEARNQALLAAQVEVAEIERKRVEQEVVHEKELATREQAQLVALIGNVAHDLVSAHPASPFICPPSFVPLVPLRSSPYCLPHCTLSDLSTLFYLHLPFPAPSPLTASPSVAENAPAQLQDGHRVHAHHPAGVVLPCPAGPADGR